VNIALYGVSRSGKNYLIDRLVQNLNRREEKTLFHVNGSCILNELSEKMLGIPLKETDEPQKRHLRLAFCDNLADMENGYRHKIVDGHYCFPNDGSFNIAFTGKDRDVYDIFFYLDTPAARIKEQANKDAIKKPVALMSEEEIKAWKEFEITSLRKICHEQNKEFVVLDNNIEDCIDYFETLLLGTRGITLDSVKIAENIINQYKTILAKYNKIILLDCDRTISNNDSTYDFCKVMGIDKGVLKDIFSGERYSLYQFFRAAKLYSQQSPDVYKRACVYAAERASLNWDLINDIKNNSAGYLSIGITSGIVETWMRIQEKSAFPHILIGGVNMNESNLIIARSVKYQLTKLLRRQGKYIIAVGDSAVDIEMLEEADKGFIVAREKINAGIEKYLHGAHSNIMQLKYNKFIYDKLPVEEGIFQ